MRYYFGWVLLVQRAYCCTESDISFGYAVWQGQRLSSAAVEDRIRHRMQRAGDSHMTACCTADMHKLGPVSLSV